MAAAFRFPAYNYANFINDAAFVNNPYAQKYDLELNRYAEYALDTYPTKCPNRTSTYGGSGDIGPDDLLKYTSRFYANYYNFLESPANYLGTDGGAIASFKAWNDSPLIVLENFELHKITIGTLQVTTGGTRVILNSYGTWVPHGLYHGMKLTFGTPSFSGLNAKEYWVLKESAYTVRLFKDSGLTQPVQASDIGLGASDATYTGGAYDVGTASSSEPYRYKLSSGGAKIIWTGSLTGFGSIQPREYSEVINGVTRYYVAGVWTRGWRVVRNTLAQSNPTKWFREGEYVGNTTYTFEKQSVAQEQTMINTQLDIDGLTANSFNITTSNDTNPYANFVMPTNANGHQHYARVYGYIDGDVLHVLTLNPGLQGSNIASGGNGFGYHRVMIGATVESATSNPAGNPQPQTYIEYGYQSGGTMTGGQTITAGSFVIGNSYTITSVGTTIWTAIGATSNTVGVTFTATGVGSGTGTAISNTGTYKLSRYYTVGSAGSPVTFTLRDSRFDLGYFPRMRTGTGSADTDIVIGTNNQTSTYDGINPREYPGRFQNTNPVAVFCESLPSNTRSNTRWKGQANDRQWEYAWETDTGNTDFGGTYDASHNSPVKQWPRHIRPAGMTWSIDQPTRVVESQNMTRWTRDSGVFRWRFKLKYPPMTREQFLPFFTALHTAHGQARGFRFYLGEIAGLTKIKNYDGIVPADIIINGATYNIIPGGAEAGPAEEVPSAVPITINASNIILDNNIIYAAQTAAAGSTTLLLEGLQPGTDNALNAGDIIKIQHTTNGQTWWDVYLIINSANTDELGRAIVRLSHPLKTAVNVGGLCYLNPDHVFVSLNSDTHDYNIDTVALHGFEVEFVCLPQMNDDTAQDRGIIT